MLQCRLEHSEIMTGKCLTTALPASFQQVRYGEGREGIQGSVPQWRALHPLQAEGRAALLPVILNVPLAAPTHSDAGLVALEMPAAICKACYGLNCAPPLNSYPEVLTTSVSVFEDSNSTEVIKVK